MTSRTNTTDEEYEKLKSGGGKKKDTLDREASILVKFKQDLSDQNVDLADIKDDKPALAKFVGKYLNNIRVPKSSDTKSNDNKVLVRPKLGYFNVTYSHLKTVLRDEIGHDLNNKTDFKDLQTVVAGIRQIIKQDGRGNTKHTPVIPNEVMMVIYNFLADVTDVMEARTNRDKKLYDKAVKKLPAAYR